MPFKAVGDRLSYVPGRTDRDAFTVSFRQVGSADTAQLCRILGLPFSHQAEYAPAGGGTMIPLSTYYTQTGYTGRIVLRNEDTAVAVYLSDHMLIPPAGLDAAYNNVTFFWVHPDYHTHTVPLHLLQLARLEMPELPTRVFVRAADEALIALLKWAGWNDVTRDEDGDDERDDLRDFRIKPVAGREHREALAEGGAVRHATPRRKRQ